MPGPLIAGDELVPIAEAAVELRVHPGSLYAQGLAGAFRLIRTGKRWSMRRWEIDALLARNAHTP